MALSPEEKAAAKAAKEAEKAAAKAAKEAEKAAAKAAKEAEKAAAKAAKQNCSSVRVSWKGQSRVYSVEVHGDGFMDLAQEFCTKVSGTLETL